jgi:hypothetical protein
LPFSHLCSKVNDILYKFILFVHAQRIRVIPRVHANLRPVKY